MNKTNRDIKGYKLLYNAPLSTNFCLWHQQRGAFIPSVVGHFFSISHSIIPLSEFWFFFVCNMVNRVFLLCTVSCDSFKRFVIPPNLKVPFCLPHTVWHGTT